MRILAGVLVAVVLAVAIPRQPLSAATACDKLTSLALPNVTITVARDVAAGAFTPSTEGGGDDPPANPRAFSALPAFCRVAATLKPSNDSDIKMELWMPAANWNGKFQAVGNGAFSGSIGLTAMAAALARGYATSSTDTGPCGQHGQFRAWASREGDRLRLACRSRDDGGVESDHRRVLRFRSASVLLEWLLRRRPAGAQGSAAFSRRLRRHHRRRAGARLDRPRVASGPRRAASEGRERATLAARRRRRCTRRSSMPAMRSMG